MKLLSDVYEKRVRTASSASSHAKGTKFTLLLILGVRNEADLVPLACEDASCEEFHLKESMALFS